MAGVVQAAMKFGGGLAFGFFLAIAILYSIFGDLAAVAVSVHYQYGGPRSRHLVGQVENPVLEAIRSLR